MNHPAASSGVSRFRCTADAVLIITRQAAGNLTTQRLNKPDMLFTVKTLMCTSSYIGTYFI